MKFTTFASILAVAIFFLGFACVTSSAQELVQTPWGLWPAHCVLRTSEEEQVVEREAGGVEIRHRANGTLLRAVPAIQECMDWHNSWKQSPRAARRLNQDVMPSANATATRNAKRFSNGWTDNALYAIPGGSASSFKATYTVPTTSPTLGGNYWLYYFIGLQNVQSNVAETILQPVLAFTGHGWTLASWNCCPAGQVHTGATLSIPAGSTIQTSMILQNNYWTVNSQHGSQTSTVTVAANGRNFNYADVTLETYDVSSCSNFPATAAGFSNLQMTSSHGTVSPSWNVNTGSTECNGRTTVHAQNYITIQHN